MAGKKEKDSEKRYCCVINISNSDSDDARNSAYWWNAMYEFGSKLIDRGFKQFVITVSPKDKNCMVMLSRDNWPSKKDGEPFSEEALTKMTWDLQKEFDYLISCKLDIL